MRLGHPRLRDARGGRPGGHGARRASRPSGRHPGRRLARSSGPGRSRSASGASMPSAPSSSRVTLEWRTIEADPRDVRLGACGRAARRRCARRAYTARQHLGDAGWANGGARPRTCRRAPAAAFATFARAAAERFPWVRRWIVWNEPNQRRWLSPAVADRLRHATPQPRGDGDQGRHPARVDRRRRDRAARRPRRHVAGRLHPRHGAGRRPARRVRAPSTSPLAVGDADVGRLRAVHDDLAGDPRPPRSRRLATRSAAASASGSPSSASRPTRRTASSASAGGRRRGSSPRPSIARTGGGCRRRDPVPPPRRAGDRRVAERPRDRLRSARSRALAAFSLPLVQVVAARSLDDGLGAGAPGDGRQAATCSSGSSADRGTRSAPARGRPRRGYLTRTLRADKGTRLRLYDPATKRASPAAVVR